MRLSPRFAFPPSTQTPALNLPYPPVFSLLLSGHTCRGDKPLALQEAPQEDTQGLAQSCLHWSLAPSPSWLLCCSGWPEGLPPSHGAQQEGMAQHCTVLLCTMTSVPRQLLLCYPRDVQGSHSAYLFRCLFPPQKVHHRAHLSDDHVCCPCDVQQCEKTLKSPCHFLPFLRFSALAMESTWKMAKW